MIFPLVGSIFAAVAAEYKTAMAAQKFDRVAEKRLDKLLNRKDFVEALNLCDEIVQKNRLRKGGPSA